MIFKKSRISLIILSIVLMLPMVLYCGGKKKTTDEAPPPKKQTQPEKKGPKVTRKDQAPTAKVESQEWSIISPFFVNFMDKGDVFSQADPFDVKSFAEEKKDIASEVKIEDQKLKDIIEEKIETPPEEVPKNQPLKYAVNRYKLIAILTGGANPTALIVDPEGNSFTVQENSSIGNNKGKVQTISRYRVTIALPNNNEHILEIKPAYINFKQIY